MMALLNGWMKQQNLGSKFVLNEKMWFLFLN